MIMNVIMTMIIILMISIIISKMTMIISGADEKGWAVKAAPICRGWRPPTLHCLEHSSSLWTILRFTNTLLGKFNYTLIHCFVNSTIPHQIALHCFTVHCTSVHFADQCAGLLFSQLNRDALEQLHHMAPNISAGHQMQRTTIPELFLKETCVTYFSRWRERPPTLCFAILSYVLRRSSSFFFSYSSFSPFNIVIGTCG